MSITKNGFGHEVREDGENHQQIVDHMFKTIFGNAHMLQIFIAASDGSGDDGNADYLFCGDCNGPGVGGSGEGWWRQWGGDWWWLRWGGAMVDFGFGIGAGAGHGMI